MNPIGEAIQKATAYLTQNPGEARYTDSAAVAVLDSGLKVTVSDPDGRTVTTDMPSGVGGENSAVSAGWLFRAALAACDTTSIAMRAATLGLELENIEVTVDSESNDFGILGIDESVPAGPLSMRTGVKVTAKDADDASIRDLVGWAVAHCPVCDATKRAIPVTVEVTTA